MRGTDSVVRRLPVGAEVQAGGGVHFRVCAPRSKQVSIVLSRVAGGAFEEHAVQLEREGGGYFSAAVPDAEAGMRYKVGLDSGVFPDPVSRFQPEGIHGPSQIVDPSRFVWTDGVWPGVKREGQVIYEMHIGTFTREGTWGAALLELPELARLGITILEVMPVAEFPGRFGWGYDGVDLFAPTRLYGTPDDFRTFVDRAHSLGLGVILDVVYNHLGPDGNYLKEYSDDFFSKRHVSEWGEAPNFDCEGCEPVRELMTANAAYWIDEFHLDGLRLDATQQLFDESDDHIIAAVSRSARAAAKGRTIYLVAENEPQHARLVRPAESGGYDLDALWNDDLHHSAMVALTGHSEAYYTDYLGTAQEFLSAAKWGYLYQGQPYKWQKNRRGQPALDVEPCCFITFLQNHDQVANSLRGARAHALCNPAQLRALTAFLLLGPGTPMLFQGQEFAASTPFLYFADHRADLAPLVAKGRREFLSQFPSIAFPESQAILAAPEAEETFMRCKLVFSEREKHREMYRLHGDLLRLRHTDAALGKVRRGSFDGAVLSSGAFLLRYFGARGDDRLLIVNLGQDLHLDPAPEPLLAPVENAEWTVKWSSEDPAYGGGGTPPVESEENWRIPGHAAVLLQPRFVSKNNHERTDPTH